MLDKNNGVSYRQSTAGFENLALSFLIARRLETLRQQDLQTAKQPAAEKYAYKAHNQIIYLTLRQHQCLHLYHQHKNIKSVAVSLVISERSVEEHLKLVRKKFRVEKLKFLMEAIDQQLISCVNPLVRF